jgi:hypothetical protein
MTCLVHCLVKKVTVIIMFVIPKESIRSIELEHPTESVAYRPLRGNKLMLEISPPNCKS